MLAELPTPEQPTDTGFYLQHCVHACEHGVERSHILPFAIDGALLLEIYVHDGIGTMIDRKSTRLNSSHLVISYAVFCLKKKKSSIYDWSQTLHYGVSGGDTYSRPTRWYTHASGTDCAVERALVG